MKTCCFESTANAAQDVFVHRLLGCDFKGTFLDIGCSHPVISSNTFNLEKCGWSGVGVDQLPWHTEYSEVRSNTQFIQADAKTINWSQELLQPSIDYLSLDVDGDTLAALKNISETIRFRVLTVEHDRYCHGDAYADQIRQVLISRGYSIVCKDVICNGYMFEDWWVDCEFVDKVKVEQTICERLDFNKIPLLCSPSPT